MNLGAAQLILSLLSLAILLGLGYIALKRLRGRTVKRRLAELESLRKAGDITGQEYERTRANVLGQL